MGAWGSGAFENDSALDWLAELEAKGPPALRDVLSMVAETGEEQYLDVDDASSAIAAAEIVAAVLGHGRDRVPPRLHSWLDANSGAIDAKDAVLAARAVDRVLATNSELSALWDASDESEEWRARVDELLSRLGGSRGRSRRPKQRGRGGAAHQEQWKAALLTFLRARGLEPDPSQMGRILASHDDAEIRGWLARAVDAVSVEAILGEK